MGQRGAKRRTGGRKSLGGRKGHAQVMRMSFCEAMEPSTCDKDPAPPSRRSDRDKARRRERVQAKKQEQILRGSEEVGRELLVVVDVAWQVMQNNPRFRRPCPKTADWYACY